MPQFQQELQLPQRAEELEEGEQQREQRLHQVLLRKLSDACAGIGRKNVCYALDIGEELLSKQLDGQDRKKPSFRLLAYCLKHEKSGELARWLLVDYAGYLPPQRPDRLKPEEFAREVAAMALGGTFGRNEAQQILALYERMERKP